jgi:hypothetical protein
MIGHPAERRTHYDRDDLPKLRKPQNDISQKPGDRGQLPFAS